MLKQNVAAATQVLPGEAASRTRPLGGILGTGSALPERVLTNDDIAQFLDTTDEWITERVGIRRRHLAGPGESTVGLSHLACERALEAAGVSAKDIDLVVLGTVTPDQPLPSSAALLQDRLGCAGAMAFDVQAACSGFLFALANADALQAIHGFGPALVIGAENLSRIVDWRDRRSCVLFGDGAGAVVYGGTDRSKGATDTTPGIVAIDLHTEGSLNDLICRPTGAFPPSTLPKELAQDSDEEMSPYVNMKGREVFKVAVSSMCSSIRTVLDKSGYTIDDIDLFIPHQSNERMVRPVCEKLGLHDESKLVLNIDRVGNTSAASIPIALDEAVRDGRVQRGDLILMTAVGAGITYGTILLRW